MNLAINYKTKWHKNTTTQNTGSHDLGPRHFVHFVFCVYLCSYFFLVILNFLQMFNCITKCFKCLIIKYLIQLKNINFFNTSTRSSFAVLHRDRVSSCVELGILSLCLPRVHVLRLPPTVHKCTCSVYWWFQVSYRCVFLCDRVATNPGFTLPLIHWQIVLQLSHNPELDNS